MTGMWANHPRMDEDLNIVAQWNGALEVLKSIIPSPRGIMNQGALGMRDPGAQAVAEIICINTGVKMLRMLPNGTHPLVMVIVVRANTSYIQST
jgi:hypothetical protein